MKILLLILATLILWMGASNQASAQQCPTLPFCKFTYTTASDGFTVVFTGSASCETGLVIKWDFGDGDVSSGNGVESPTHVYAVDGTYVVKMSVNLPAPNTACKHTHTEVITITAGTPAFLQLDLTGPTIAAKCQQVTYSANVVGGLPPYTYQWEFDNYYCSSCSGSACNPTGINNPMLTGGPTQTVQFDYTGTSKAIFTVTVTDAQGTSKSETVHVTVKDAFSRLEIRTTAENASCGYYGINSNILFWPDIDPLFNFEYPTKHLASFNWRWTGTPVLDLCWPATHGVITRPALTLANSTENFVK